MVALEFNESLQIGFAGQLDASLTALLFCGDTVAIKPDSDDASYAPAQRSGQRLLLALEEQKFDGVIVPFEEFAYYAWMRKSTDLRIVGSVLDGDTRVILELEPARRCTGERILAAASPSCAAFRFQDLSDAFDFEFPFSTRAISLDGLLEAIDSQSFDFVEANSYSEGVAALKTGAAQRAFKMSDYGAPASCSHMLIVHSRMSANKKCYLQRIKKQLLHSYEEILSNVEQVVRNLVTRTEFKFCSDEKQLFAALRVLGPHMAGALRSRCMVTWKELEPFYRWLHLKGAQMPEFCSVGGLVHLNHLICDFWSEC